MEAPLRAPRATTSYARFVDELFRASRPAPTCTPPASGSVFRLAGRKPLDLVELLPPSFNVDRDAFRRMLESRDYLVLSYRQYSDELLVRGNPVLEEFVARGEQRRVGTPGGPGYAGLVVKLRSAGPVLRQRGDDGHQLRGSTGLATCAWKPASSTRVRSSARV